MNDTSNYTTKRTSLNPGEFSASHLSAHARRILAAKGMMTVRTYSPHADGGFTAYNKRQSIRVAGEELSDNWHWGHLTSGDPIARVK